MPLTPRARNTVRQRAQASYKPSDSLSVEAIKALKDAVTALSDTTQVLHDAVFGRWDALENRQIPGLQGKSEVMEKRFDSMIWSLKMVAFFAAVPLVTVFLKAIGVPTEDIAHTAGNFWAYFLQPH